METCVVMVVASLQRAEEILLAGEMPCPRCQGVLRPFGTGRPRTVRGVGADTVTVTPRRARLSYRRAAEVVKPASGGATLHQLRHSQLTHLAEAGIALPMLMAKTATPA